MRKSLYKAKSITKTIFNCLVSGVCFSLSAANIQTATPLTQEQPTTKLSPSLELSERAAVDNVSSLDAVLNSQLESAKLEAQAEILDKQRKKFIQAEHAARKRDWNQFSQLTEQLKDYPLYHYLVREQLMRNFSLSQTHEIEAFLAQAGDEPVARRLRYKWLYWLARNNHASLFLTHYRDFGSVSLKCKHLEYRLRTDEKNHDIFKQTENLWMTPNSIPSTCNPLIKRWKQAGLMSSDKIWKRFQLAINAKQYRVARYLKSQLPPTEQGAADLLESVIKNPKKLASINFRLPLTDKAKDIIRTGLNKLSWRDANKTIEIWHKLGSQYEYTEALPELKRNISLSLAIDKDPKAEDWLNSLSDQQDESVMQWMLSTALHAMDWQKVATITAQFSKDDPDTYQWIYWNAVAETQLGNLETAATLFESLAGKRSYYGFLAARQLNKQPELAHKPIQFSEQELIKVKSNPAAIRSKEFLALNRMTDARREWNQLVTQTPLDEQLKLAMIAHQWGWQHQAILAFARSKQIDDVEKRFPLEHFEIFAEQSKKNQIPMSWAYAITRQESAFKTDAISHAGARGLMQLKPSTAKGVAQNIAYKDASQLLTADTNISLGTAHLSQMLQSFKANPVLATAAYNAGKSRVLQWVKEANTADSIQWIEQIPYKETRDYVKNVLTYQLIYAKLTNQKDDFLSQLHNYPIIGKHNNTAAK